MQRPAGAFYRAAERRHDEQQPWYGVSAVAISAKPAGCGPEILHLLSLTTAASGQNRKQPISEMSFCLARRKQPFAAMRSNCSTRSSPSASTPRISYDALSGHPTQPREMKILKYEQSYVSGAERFLQLSPDRLQ